MDSLLLRPLFMLAARAVLGAGAGMALRTITMLPRAKALSCDNLDGLVINFGAWVPHCRFLVASH